MTAKSKVKEIITLKKKKIDEIDVNIRPFDDGIYFNWVKNVKPHQI